jgi:hypothetical protein
MKFYESHYEDYYKSVETCNFHEELLIEYDKFPKSLDNFCNMIIYGPSGVGKYSQMLYLLKNYSPSLLKYEKKITAIIDKQTYIYKISDIHYEVDMALLGCNSKIIWHEVFQQIVDIVSIKSNKHGIIVCKNFHFIHNELLDIFNSYIQQYSGVNNQIMDSIKIKFILLSEHLSFIPDKIIDNSYILHVKRPSTEKLLIGMGIRNPKKMISKHILENLETENIMNAKEIYSFPLIKTVDDLPKDNFNIICDDIIQEMKCHKKMVESNNSMIDVSKFRDKIYDILIYNLDVCDCIWYIFSYFVNNNYFDLSKINCLMEDLYLFLRQYGNNYRAIFHIERIIFAMIGSFDMKIM